MIGANFYAANLSKARLINTDLRGADLGSADLGGATFWLSDLSGCNSEPKPGLPEISRWKEPKGLSSLTYRQFPHGLVELREIFKKAGHRDHEREVNFALNHARRLKSWEQGGLFG